MASICDIVRRAIGAIRPQQIISAQIVAQRPDMCLAGKRVVVTGGTGGLGEAMARRFVAEGAGVLVCGRSEEKLAALSGEIGCEALPLDLTDVNAFDAFVTEAIKKLGGIDCLVNNAGNL